MVVNLNELPQILLRRHYRWLQALFGYVSHNPISWWCVQCRKQVLWCAMSDMVIGACPHRVWSFVQEEDPPDGWGYIRLDHPFWQNTHHLESDWPSLLPVGETGYAADKLR